MLSKNEVLALRELALSHLPETRALSEKMYKENHDSRAALQAVAWAPTLAINSPLSSPATKQAGILLSLVGQHPETHTEHLNDAADDEIFGGELTATLLADAHRDREITELNLLAVTRELCHLSGAALPPWFPVEDAPKLTTVEVRTTPQLATKNESIELSGLSKRAKQINAILEGVKVLEIEPMKIPTGEKQNIKKWCKKTHPAIFGAGDDPFSEAWRLGVKEKKFRMKDHDKFKG